MLWGRSASRCSICKRELVIDATETDDLSVVGEAAHIVAESADGPRGDADVPLSSRNSYNNLILLCNIHHKLVDDQPNTYCVEILQGIKQEHEQWVKSRLSTYDPSLQADDEIWATYVQEWEVKAHIAEWLDKTYGLLQPDPFFARDFLLDLKEIRDWILSRIWPEHHSEIRSAMGNFRVIANDLVNVYEKYADDEMQDGIVRTRKFYQITEWDETRYHRLLREYEYHLDLIQDLTCELTRAANFLCDVVRGNLDRSYRRNEGVLLVIRGIDMSLQETTLRLEYRNEERVERPYEGLAKFMTNRLTRDYWIGEGVNQKYLPLRLE